MAGAAAALGPAAAVVAGLGSALGIAAGGAVLLSKNLADTVEQLDNLSAVTGVSVDNLQVLQELFKRSGLDADVARTALFRLNQEIDKQNPLLARLGVTTRDPMEALLQLSDAFRSSTDAAARARAAQELLGRGGKDLLAVLDSLRESFPSLRAEMEQTGQLMGADMVDAGRKFDREWERLTGRFEGFMNRLKGAAAEAANALIDAFSKPATAEDAVARQEKALTESIGRLKKGLAEARKDIESNQEVAIFNVGGSRSQLADALFGDPRERIKMFQEKIAEAERHLGILRGTVREFGQDDLPQMVSAQKAAADLLSAATKEHDKASAAVKRHSERVQELVDLFGMQRAKAEEVIRAQERLEQLKRKEALAKELFEPKQIPGIEVTAKSPEVAGIPGILPGLDARQQVLADWHSFIGEIESSAGRLRDTLNSLHSGLTSGFTQVFQGLLTEGQTFRSAMVTIFTSMVNELLAQLARMLAFRVIGAVIGVPPVAISPPIIPIGQTPVLAAGRSLGVASTAAAGPVDQRTFIIQTLAAQDVVANLVLPSGSLRRANDRVAVAGAY
jgi:ribosomal protein S15P/S13E